MPRQINEETLAKLKQWEGFVGYAYDDFDKGTPKRRIMPGMTVRGTLTIGYGSTGTHVKPGNTISEVEASKLLREDLTRFEKCVEKNVKVPLNDNAFGALVSFCFNVGEGNFLSSTLLKRVNANRFDEVPAEFMKWTKSKGVYLPGLANRRSVEAALWAKGSHVSSNYVEVTAPTAKKSVMATVVAGVGTVTLAIQPAVPAIVSAITENKDALTSGDWVRIGIAVVVIVGTAAGAICAAKQA